MVHLSLRAESRPNERRAALTPDGTPALVARGFRVTVEESPHRIVPLDAYVQAGVLIRSRARYSPAARASTCAASMPSGATSRAGVASAGL